MPLGRGGQVLAAGAGRGALCIRPHLREVGRPRSSGGVCTGRGHQHCRVTFRVSFHAPTLKSGEESHSCQALVTIGLFSKGPNREQERLVRVSDFQLVK